MRGAERPAKIHWTHPFLLPLQPLSDEAAQQTFMGITDNVDAKEDIENILQFTDNMPLAVICLTMRVFQMSWLDGTLKRQLCFLWGMTESPI
jgi:hypothetical protein